jgi:hypothetical protein
MKVNDMDIDDFMVSPTKDIDAFEEDEESEDFDAGADGESFFETVEKEGETKNQSQ